MERKLNKRKRVAHKKRLTPIIAMSGCAFDPFEQVFCLPRGGVFIFRHYELMSEERAQLASELTHTAHCQRKLILIASDMRLAYRVKADGMHYPEWYLNRLGHIQRLRPDWLVSVAAHNLGAVRRAQRLGADWVLVSPIFELADKGKALGVCRLADYTHRAYVSVIALGGIRTEVEVKRLKRTGILGYAGSSGFAFGKF